MNTDRDRERRNIFTPDPTCAENNTSMDTSQAVPVQSPVSWMGNQTLHDICDLSVNAFSIQDGPQTAVGLVLLHASWNWRKTEYPFEEAVLSKLIREATKGLDFGPNCQAFACCVQIDQTTESLGLCLGDSDHPLKLPFPPEDLPTLAIVAQTSSMEHSIMRYVPKIGSRDLVSALSERSLDTTSFISGISNKVRRTVEGIESMLGIHNVADDSTRSKSALRIFVAGDRSSVGKSSVCLGILGNLLATGYAASDLGYIKPATQSESTQLIEEYCKYTGIACVPIGPLVYYRGFTRAFLAGETASTEQLLADCGRAVDQVARGKRVVLVDGVGFPAVGSICGTDNASVSLACGYPVTDSSSSSSGSSNSSGNTERKPLGVVLVGGSGVGGAVDAFNLNATYFENRNVPVLGAIFNKLSVQDGYYSLENCKQQVAAYFDQDAHHQAMGRRPFGFVPLFPGIAGPAGMDHVHDYVRVFGSHVDTSGIVEAATRVKESAGPVTVAVSTTTATATKDCTTKDGTAKDDATKDGTTKDGTTKDDTTKDDTTRPVKRRKVAPVSTNGLSARNRAAIEAKAIGAGAAPSA
jgi:dethiobiotin synthetase